MVSATFAICVSALFLQTISAQFRRPFGVQPIANPIPEALPNNLAYTMPYGPIAEPMLQAIPENSATFNGGGFKVTSYSSVGPTGLNVQSDNLAVEGPLAVTGKLPFLGVVTVEGPLPAVGQGSVAYECGNGNVGIVSEGAVGDGLGVSAGLTGLGYNGISNGMPVGRY
ncbi:chorion class B protein M2807-like [Pararge aegeria]|uniref:Jg18777 protein n=2 Tax=Pararge aegeria TaxID=116150 RepID=A0A8S4S4Z9_9NEOP|nr:chorion class B protein M2807-like [Pararge aegeria]CAH2249548.1 jg18777 [Pararge aegeria aegeria]